MPMTVPGRPVADGGSQAGPVTVQVTEAQTRDSESDSVGGGLVTWTRRPSALGPGTRDTALRLKGPGPTRRAVVPLPPWHWQARVLRQRPSW